MSTHAQMWSQRIDWEIDALIRAGIPTKIRFRNDRSCSCSIEIQHPLGIGVVVDFPYHYPYTAFEAKAPQVTAKHHQNPVVKNLCLLGPTGWRTDDTVMNLLASQLPQILSDQVPCSKEEAARIELIQPEPTSVFLNYLCDSAVLVDEGLMPKEHQLGGTLQMVGMVQAQPFRLSAAVVSVEDVGESALSFAQFSSLPVACTWVRTDLDPGRMSADEFLRRLLKQHRALRTPRWFFNNGARRFELIGVIFQEELDWRTKGPSWLFIARQEIARKGFRKGVFATANYVRSDRVGRSIMYERAPELLPLQSKKVAFVGLGCVGAPAAIELARAGLGDLRLMDPDVFESPTALRWPLGVTAAGKAKVRAVGEFIAQNYPATNVTAAQLRVGATPEMGGASAEQIEIFFKDVDLLMDGTADPTINRLLSMEARARSIPHIFLSSTPGGWGGTVGRAIQGQTGCYDCYELAMQADSPEEFRLPAAPNGPVDPAYTPGCAAPTFKAAGVDVSEASLCAARMAISTLCGGAEGGYPSMSWDLALLALRNQDGNPILPQWKSHALRIHPSCPNH